MHPKVETNPGLSLKPLGQLGRDEMNIAEFPIALLTDRVPKDQKEAIYQDEIYDDRTGRTLARKLTIQAGNYGLTTAVDDEVILALIQLTRLKTNFKQPKIDFSRHELIQMLGWNSGGASYERILLSLRKWTSVYLDYENAWRDNRTKTWLTKGFHIIESFEFNDNRTSSDLFELIPSYIVWNEVIFESFQAGYLKPLDYDLCMGLSNSTAKRMYRFLDKRFHQKQDLEFELKLFAHEHIGLGRNYDGPAHLKRKLQPAIKELESVGFLEPLQDSQRYPKAGKNWKIRLIQNGAPPAEAITSPQPAPSPLITALTSRGVTDKTAFELVQQFPAEFISSKIEEFDWEMTQAKPPKKPAGYLVKSIRDGYATDPNFVSTAERERQAEAKRQKDEAAAASRRQQREQEAAEKAEHQAINAYWESLTPKQQAECQAAADAQASPEELAQQTGSLKSFGQTIRRRDYIRQLLKNRQTEPA